MYDLIPLVVFLVLVICYVGTQKKRNNLVYALVAIIAILGVCYYDVNEKFSNYAPVDHKMKSCASWKAFKKPNTPHKLLSETTIFSPVGEGIKLTTDIASKNFPTVDGDPNSPKQLFTLAHNQCHPGCCPSTYSCSTGCVCTTDKQRSFINNRGGNHAPNGNPDI